jgi:hypothetical protein
VVVSAERYEDKNHHLVYRIGLKETGQNEWTVRSSSVAQVT